MYVLGISCFYHDAAACLLKDGEVIAAAEEERFTRKKHDNEFPLNAIKYCLKEANISISDVDYVGFYEKPLIKFERILQSNLDGFPNSYLAFYKAIPSWLTEKLRVPSVVRKKIKYKGNVLFVDHHMSHAASAFLVSPYKKAAILTVDGVGEWATTTVGYGEDNKIKIFKEIHFPHSIGLLYSAVTVFLGFKANNDEYKVMGLASYGKPKYYDNFKKILKLKEDGSFELDMSYFTYHHTMRSFSKKFVKEFGEPRKYESVITQRDKDIAASLQKITEEAIVNLAKHAYELTKVENLCIAGGVGLNCVANSKILKETKFKNVFIQPAAGDSGGAIGVATYIYNVILKHPRKYEMKNAYLGPGFSDNEIRSFLLEKNVKFKEYDEAELLKAVAKLIKDNYIIGWFQGRMEWGPRALGNRSILANACNPKMKDILNDRVKHREDFRPFAPAAIKEEVENYFDIMQYDPFMLFICDVKENKKDLVPSITHSDGSARLQSVEKEVNPRYYNLIVEFGKLSGVPVIINTSFNVRGEPIVCTPSDAYKCFMGTGIDYLVMGKFVIDKKENLKDKWDSKKVIKE